MNRLDEQCDFDEAWHKLGSLTGELAFNIGANHGQAARLLAKNFAHVVAYEPCEESFRELERTAPDNVHPVPVAVGDHDGVMTLYVKDRSIDSGQLTAEAGLPYWGEIVGTRIIESTTVDTEAVLFGAPDLIQIDTEGHEVQVIQGGLGVINTAHPQLFIEIHAHDNTAEIVSLLPEYIWETFRWPNTRPESVLFDHYWVHGCWGGDGQDGDDADA